MRAAFLRLLGLLAPVFLGLATSTILLVDYLRKAPIICAEGGCDAIKHTVFARPLGIPTPLFGVLGFLAMGILMLAREERWRRTLSWIAAAGAAIGLGFFIVQWRLGTFCQFCMVCDASALLVFALVYARDRAGWLPPAAPRVRASVLTLLAMAFGIPLIVALAKSPIVPEVISEELTKAPRGKVVVVDFVDFECPFCRMTHESLEPLLEQHRDRLVVVRELVPLTRIHPHALDAARAACCGEQLGKGEALANALFTAPVEELTREGCLKIAVSLGLGEDAFRACLDDPKTDERLARDRATFDKAAAKGDGLPLIWIGTEKLMGAQDPETLRSAVEGAIARAGS